MPRLPPKTANLAALGLVFVGCLPVTGYLVDSRVLRGLGAATAEATVAVRAAVRVAVKGEAATAAATEEVVRGVAARAPTQQRMSFARR
jgi:hypothetical protein